MSNNSIFKSSPKIFQNYKSENPSRTVLAVKKALKNLGINLSNLKYTSEKIGGEDGFSIYKAGISYNGQHIASGKGVSYKLSEASAYAETTERIPLNMSPLNAEINFKTDQEEKWLRGYIKKNESKIKNAVKISEFLKNFPAANVEEIKKNNWANEWVDAFSFTENKYKKVPHLLIREVSNSNGCAAGNTLEEAVSQAFCEVCERYACIESYLKKLPAPTIDPKTIKNKEIIGAIDLFNSMNFDIEIKDLTLGNKIPAMGVLFTNQNLAHEKNTLKKKMFYRSFHVGSHFDLNEAIMRCFIEEWQISVAGLRAFLYHQEMDIVDHFFSDGEKEKIVKEFEKDLKPLILMNRSFENYDFLKNNSPARSFDTLSSYRTNDFLEDMKLIKIISQKNHWKTMFIDYSIPKLPLRVVKVVVPSVSDTLRYYYPETKKPIKLPLQRPMPPPLRLFCLDKKIDINELISAAQKTASFKKMVKKENLNLQELLTAGEKELSENILRPSPFPNTSPLEILTILKTGYSVLGSREKHLKANNLLENYFG